LAIQKQNLKSTLSRKTLPEAFFSSILTLGQFLLKKESQKKPVDMAATLKYTDSKRII